MCFNGISEEKLKSSIRACFPCKGSHDTEWVFGLHAFRRSLVWSICIYDFIYICCVHMEKDITVVYIVTTYIAISPFMQCEVNTILYENRNKKHIQPRGVEL